MKENIEGYSFFHDCPNLELQLRNRANTIANILEDYANDGGYCQYLYSVYAEVVEMDEMLEQEVVKVVKDRRAYAK